jgi:Fibronectin type III domain
MASTVRVHIAFFLVAFAATILGGCNNSNDSTNGTASSAATTNGGSAATTNAGSTSGVADLSWTTPMATTEQLAGYHIYYGTKSTDLTYVVNVDNPGSTSFTVNNLATGTWYFAIKSYDTANAESNLSAVVAVTI